MSDQRHPQHTAWTLTGVDTASDSARAFLVVWEHDDGESVTQRFVDDIVPGPVAPTFEDACDAAVPMLAQLDALRMSEAWV